MPDEHQTREQPQHQKTSAGNAVRRRRDNQRDKIH